MLLTPTDLDWLRTAYPHLTTDVNCSEIRGEISFSAAYDAVADQFAIQRPYSPEPAGLSLSASYRIHIKDIMEPAPRRLLLPRLYIDDEAFPFCPDRHFNSDNSGCLCGPSDEMALVAEGYVFPKFVEELCVPFLYGQTYCDRYGKWPWRDYHHGTLGVLESYFALGSAENIQFTLLVYLQGRPSWQKVRSILKGGGRPLGHMPCFCGSGKPIRSCHVEAWEGLKKLCRDFRIAGVPLPIEK